MHSKAGKFFGFVSTLMSERSFKALERLGAPREGILRAYGGRLQRLKNVRIQDDDQLNAGGCLTECLFGRGSSIPPNGSRCLRQILRSRFFRDQHILQISRASSFIERP